MHSLLLTNGIEERELRYGTQAAMGWTRVAVRDLDHARRLVAASADDMWRLRALLASGGEIDLARLSDHEVVHEVARMLAAHRLALFRPAAEAAEAASARAGGGSGGAANVAAAPAAAASPAPARGRSGNGPSPQQAPAHPVSAEEPEYAAASQDRQAATLRQAARNGTPFCEICELRKAARTAAAAQRAGHAP